MSQLNIYSIRARELAGEQRMGVEATAADSGLPKNVDKMEDAIDKIDRPKRLNKKISSLTWLGLRDEPESEE